MGLNELLEALKERETELIQDLKEEPNHNSNHMASMIAGELEGIRWVINLLVSDELDL